MTTQAITASGPWYRERWPWLLAAGPAIVVVAAAFTAWLAMASDDGLVADDYYKRGLAINKVLEREARADALRIGAVVSIGTSGDVRVALTSDPGGTPAPATVRLRLAHPTRAGNDAVVVLARTVDETYVGQLATPPKGRRLFTVETESWRLPSAESIVPGETRLGTKRIAR